MGRNYQKSKSLSIEIFTIALSLVIPDIGIHMGKLDGVRRVSEKIFQMFTKVSGCSDSKSYSGKIGWPVSTGLSGIDSRSAEAV
jgi:hypothetical protein